MENVTLLLQACLGLGMFFLLSWFFSEDRKKINFRQTFIGFLIQILVALIVTRVELICIWIFRRWRHTLFSRRWEKHLCICFPSFTNGNSD